MLERVHWKVTILAASAVLAGCTTSSNTGRVATQSINDAKAEEAALIQRVNTIFLSDGVTQQSELPAGGATYDGLVHGSAGSGTGPDLEYYADLTLDVDFDTDDVSGTVDNFRTDLGGFSSPGGSIAVTGAVSTTPGVATLDYSGNGNLTGTDRSANLSLTADGTFIGDGAEAAAGLQESDFVWLTGPDAGDTSVSDGTWTAEQ